MAMVIAHPTVYPKKVYVHMYSGSMYIISQTGKLPRKIVHMFLKMIFKRMLLVSANVFISI